MKRQSDNRVSADSWLDSDTDGGFEPTTVRLPEGIKRFKLDSADKRLIDVIPFIAGEGNPAADPGQSHIERTFFVHRSVGPKGSSYICPKETIGKKCPICEAAAGMSRDEAKNYRPSKRQLWNVIDVDNREDGIQVWDVSNFFFGKQLKEAVRNADEDEDFKYFADPEGGYTLKLAIEEGSFQKRKFFKVSRVDFKPRKKQYKKSIKKEATCLDDCLIILSYKELKDIFEQTPADEDEDDDEGSVSTKKGKKDMKRKAVTAATMGIEKGCTVEHDELGECEVTAVSKDGFLLTLVDSDGDTHKGIGVAEVELMPDEDDEPKKKGKKGGKKPAGKKGKKAVEEDEDDDDEDDDTDDDEDDDDEEEDDSDDDDDDDDEESDDEDESDDDEDDEDDDDESDEDDEDDDDDDDDEPVTKKRGRPAAKKKAPAKSKAKGKPAKGKKGKKK